MERIARPVDDRLEQFVPGPRGRRQAGHLVQEAQLLELVRGARRQAALAPPGQRGFRRLLAGAFGGQIGHGDHDTSVGNVGRSKGCDVVVRAVRYGRSMRAA